MLEATRRLELRGATVHHGARNVAINQLNLTLQPGITALLGPNGAGKSTLLSALANPRRFNRGSVLLNNIDFTDRRQPLRRYFQLSGYMPQTWEWFSGFTVRQSVEYSAWLKGLGRHEAREATTSSLRLLHLSDKEHCLIKELSGGMKQRVGLAEAIVHQPDLLFLDEPTVSLDPRQRRTFRESLKQAGQNRITLLSTHLAEDVVAVADHVAILKYGKLAFYGTTSELAQTGKYNATQSYAERINNGYEFILGAEAT